MTAISATPADFGALPLTERQQQGFANARAYLEAERTRKKIIAIGCADSRFVPGMLLDDPGVQYSCDVGGTTESEKPGGENFLNDEAKAFFDEVIKKGDVEVIAYFPHGKCGCVRNACACAEEKAKKETGHVAHEEHDAHAHGGKLEGKILAEMGARKEYAVKMVKDPAKYLTGMGFDISKVTDKIDLMDMAVEIAHGIHQRKIIQKYLESKGLTIKVEVPFYDIRTNESYIFLEGQGANKKDLFVKVTPENIETLPEAYKELGKSLLAGAKAIHETWEKNDLAKSQSPKIAAVGYGLADVSTDMLLNSRPNDVFTLSNASGLQNPTRPGELGTQGKEFLTYAAHIGVEDIVIYAGGPSREKKEYAAGNNTAESYLTKLGIPVKGLTHSEIHDRANNIAHALEDREIANAHLAKLYEEKPEPKKPINVHISFFDQKTLQQYQYDQEEKAFKILPEPKQDMSTNRRPGLRPKGKSLNP